MYPQEARPQAEISNQPTVEREAPLTLYHPPCIGKGIFLNWVHRHFLILCNRFPSLSKYHQLFHFLNLVSVLKYWFTSF